MVTHDARARRSPTAILFLADGLIVARRSGALRPHDIVTAMEELSRRVIRFALKGLGGRKLRTALTAIAIVLGVAMVSGTYILTDSIDRAFDGIFTEIYRGTDATITAKSAFDLSNRPGTTDAAVRRVAARHGPRRCRTSPTRSAASAARRT